MSNKYILDACALIAYLNNEPGMDVVKTVLTKAVKHEASVTMNKINLLEVYYDVYRRCGEDEATDLLETISVAPINIIHEISDDVLKVAGRLKASYKISIADSIALAEALLADCQLVTSDHHEFDIIEKSENITFHWIR